jgi:hypothetical protein
MIGERLQCIFLVLPVLGNRSSRFDANHLERVKWYADSNTEAVMQDLFEDRKKLD